MITPYYQDDKCTIYHGDCREIIPTIGNVDLILTDPPYFQVKDEDWDRQWQSADLFIDWLSSLSNLWKSKLAQNGSLYCFASPQMAARVEVMLQGNFNVLNHLVWEKGDISRMAKKEPELRKFVPMSERIIFCDHYNSDQFASGEYLYNTESDQLRGFVFEPIRKYLADERDKACLTNSKINDAWCRLKNVNSTSQTQKWFSSSCFNPPTESAYLWLREISSGFFAREYEDLRREYEDLRREYEDLRRFCNIPQSVQHTDVWHFDSVPAYPGKHECEKPQSMLRHIIEVSTKPEALVLDSFMGSGSTLLAARDCGRKAIGIEAQEKWCEHAAQKLSQSVFSFD